MVCASCGRSVPRANDGHEPDATRVHQLEKEAISICELERNPFPYQKQTITIRTTVYRIDSLVSAGDESCVGRHPLFDVEFDYSFVEGICSPNEVDAQQLCAFSKPTGKNPPSSNIAITGIFTGHFEAYQVNEGFRSNGMRFRFTVKSVESVFEVIPSIGVRIK